jgi:hypothetical protein
VMRRAGYESTTVTTDWLPKELSVVAQKSGPSAEGDAHDFSFAKNVAFRQVRWLGAVAKEAQRLSEKKSFGIFGTSSAAGWLYAEVEGKMECFVDEDRSRAGRRWLEKPIYHPSDVPSGADVLIGLPPRYAEAIKARLLRTGLSYTLHVPPDVPDAD